MMPNHFLRTPHSLNRRDFLKLAALGLGSLSLSPWKRLFSLPDFPQSERLGRVCVDGPVEIKIRPDYESQSVGQAYGDTVFPWIKETIGRWPYRNNQHWVETPEGYIWCPFMQPVKDQRNQPVSELPQMGDERGMWVEVTVPYVDAILDNGPARSAWWRYRISNGQPYRFYYSQILWVDGLKTEDDGSTWYRINERYGNPGDIFWCPAEAFRPITEEEITPISPNVEDKRIVVDVNWTVQTLSCFEGNSEVYYCRVSSGQDDGSTPLSAPSGFNIWRKLISLHMGGSTAAGSWDVPAIGWTSLFQGDGVAIHSTYWHNNYGEPMSHGCVNVSPADAKWIFRWTTPRVPFDTGDLTTQNYDGTKVIVQQW